MPACLQAENSEVLPFGSVAVAVTQALEPITVAELNVKLVLPLAVVLTFLEPRKVWPSPFPDASQALFVKNSSL